MEPLTTATMIGSIVVYIGKQLANNKSVKEFISDFTDVKVKWMRSIFLKDDGTEKEVVQKLKEKPNSEARQNTLKSVFEMELEDNPNAENYIKEIFEKIAKTEEGGKIVNTIINSKNVNTGNVNTGGGDFRIGNSK